MQRAEMAFGQVHDMNVIPHPGPVRRGVVIAPDIEMVPTPHRDLRHEGHEVVGYPARILADQPALVRTHRVEIPEDGDFPVRLSTLEIAQHFLDHELGTPIGVGGRERMILGVG